MGKYDKIHVKAAIFDMDGTMIDSEPISALAWRKAGAAMGAPVDEDFISSIRGLSKVYSKKYALSLWGEDFDYDKLHSLHSFYFNEYADQNGIPVKKGLYELMAHLEKQGIKLGVATSTRQAPATARIKEIGVYERFSAYTFGDQVEKSKPDPEVFLKTMAKLQVEPNDCVVFEDSPNGLKAARASGAYVVAVPDLTPIEGEIASFADRILTSLDEAIAIIENK